MNETDILLLRYTGTVRDRSMPLLQGTYEDIPIILLGAR